MSKQLIVEEFKKRLEELFDAILIAKIHYQIWWILNDEEKKYEKIWKRYDDFFIPTFNAHFTAMLMAICKVYVSGRNFEKLIKTIKKYFLLEAKTVREIEHRFRSELKPLFEKVKIPRNKYFAHIVSDGGSAFKNAKIKPQDCRRLIDLTFDLLNKISNAYDGNKFSFEYCDSGEITTSLLSTIDRTMK